MRKVKDAVDLTTNEKIYFKGHAKATYLSDGNNVEDTMGGVAEAVMGIHENLSANYATKQYVQDALAEIPSGESLVFEAEYGVTTYNEIIEAHNEGKIVICQDGVWVTRLTRVQATQVQFQCSSFPNVTRLTCSDANVWSRGSFNVEHNMETLANGNVKIKIATQTAEVATPQYVENLLGTIINGDY